MNCIIPGPNLKVFARALHALAKVGDNLYIEASDSNITFVSLNLRKTICVKCTFFDSFFSSYELNRNDNVSCKIQMKTLIPLFKGTHLEKKFEYIKIQYQSDDDDELTFKMKYKCDDIMMLHKLRLMDPESLKIQITPDDGCNDLIGSSNFYNQLLNTFGNTDDEITLEILKQKVIARNYCVGTPVKPRSVRSHVNLNPSEFTSFHVEKETSINFSLKPVRTAIQFAEGFNLNIALNFEKGGKPLIIVMKNPTFEVNFIVATLDPYSDGLSSLSTSSIPAQITQKNNNEKVNLTVEDQQALLNENWDDIDMETDQTSNKNTANKIKASFQEILSRNKRNNRRNRDDVITASKGDGRNSDRGRDEVLSKAKDDTGKNADEIIINGNGDNMDVIPPSPESPKTKRAKLVFGRCFESTFSANLLGEVLAPNSDSE